MPLIVLPKTSRPSYLSLPALPPIQRAAVSWLSNGVTEGSDSVFLRIFLGCWAAEQSFNRPSLSSTGSFCTQSCCNRITHAKAKLVGCRFKESVLNRTSQTPVLLQHETGSATEKGFCMRHHETVSFLFLFVQLVYISACAALFICRVQCQQVERSFTCEGSHNLHVHVFIPTRLRRSPQREGC